MLRRIWLHLPDLIPLFIALIAQIQLIRWLYATPAPQRSGLFRKALWFGGVFLCLWIAFGFIFNIPRFARWIPYSYWFDWARGAALAWALAVFGAFIIALIWRHLPQYNPQRRSLLRAAGGVAVGAPFAAMGFAMFVQRLNLNVREIDMPVANLPSQLDGLRLVLLSDIHLSPYLSQSDLERAVGMANDLRGQVALVTGDLVTSAHDPLEACLKHLSRLRADAGILGCLGNHEIYAGAQKFATVEGARRGIRFLRQEAVRLRFGGSFVNFAGVDYQAMNLPYLVGVEALVAPRAPNILLSHNPDVFPVAAEKGFDLTLSGHTHGGQVTVEILHQHLNVARFWTPYVYGTYHQGPASIYVTRGIGTVGIPARFGAPPEVVLLRLRSNASLIAGDRQASLCAT